MLAPNDEKKTEVGIDAVQVALRPGEFVADIGASGIEGAACAFPRKIEVERADTAKSLWHLVSAGMDGQRRIVECRSGLTTEIYSPAVRVMRPVPRNQLSAKQRKSFIQIKRPVLEQLFPGYFFIKFDRRDDRWQDVFRLVGVYGIVCEGDTPVPITDALIESLRSKEVNGAVPGKVDAKTFAYELGETVRLTNGPFIGFDAVITQMPTKPIEELDEDARVSLLVSLFGRKCSVSMPIGDFEKKQK